MTQSARAEALRDEDEPVRARPAPARPAPARPAPARPAPARPAPARARRTVTITGRPDRRPAPPPRLVEVQRRRPPRHPVERLGSRPDRLAMWAVAMALFLILVTLTSPGG